MNIVTIQQQNGRKYTCLNETDRLLQYAFDGIHLGVIELGKSGCGKSTEAQWTTNNSSLHDRPLWHLRLQHLWLELMAKEFVILDIKIPLNVWKLTILGSTYNITADTLLIYGKGLHG